MLEVLQDAMILIEFFHLWILDLIFDNLADVNEVLLLT